MKRFDDAIFAAIVRITGLEARDFEADGGVPGGARIRLPCKSGGLGIRRHTGVTAKASFMGMLIKTPPHMIDANVVGGDGYGDEGFSQFLAGATLRTGELRRVEHLQSILSFRERRQSGGSGLLHVVGGP